MTTSFRRGQVPYGLYQQEEDIVHFSLTGLLPPEYVLSLNFRLGTLACLTSEGVTSRMVLERHFTATEIRTLLPLCESFPYYCNYETLLASFEYGKTSERVLAMCRKRLADVYGTEQWDMEMRPVRNVLSRTRIKLRDFNIAVISLFETGYILTSIPQRTKEEERPEAASENLYRSQRMVRSSS